MKQKNKIVHKTAQCPFTDKSELAWHIFARNLLSVEFLFLALTILVNRRMGIFAMSDFSDDMTDPNKNTDTASPAKRHDEADWQDYTAEGDIIEKQARKVEVDTLRYEKYVRQQTNPEGDASTRSGAAAVEEQAERVEAGATAYSDAIEKQSKTNNGNGSVADGAETVEAQSEILEKKSREFEERVIARSRELLARTRKQSAENARSRSAVEADNDTGGDQEDSTDTLTETMTVSETDTVIDPDGTIESHTVTKTDKLEEKSTAKPSARKGATKRTPQKSSAKPSQPAGKKK